MAGEWGRVNKRLSLASRGKNGVCLLFRLGVASFQTPKIPRRRLETKAREIDPEHETEMNWSSVEDHRTIVLDVKCRADYDKATPKALCISIR